MGLIEEINFNGVTGARFGKYNLAENSSSIIYKVGDTIIDTGPSNQLSDVKAYFKDKDIKKIILTHHHEDHCGNAEYFAKKLNLPVYIHELGISFLKKGFTIKMYQKVFWGSAKTLDAKPFLDEIDTGNDFILRPIHTPGHSTDHVCFIEESKKILFTGDLFIAQKPKLFRIDEDLKQQINSLEKILSYDFQTVFCCHKGVLYDGYEQLEKKLNYFYGLIEKVKDLKHKNYKLKQISENLLGKKDPISKISLGNLSKKNLIKECVAYKKG